LKPAAPYRKPKKLKILLVAFMLFAIGTIIAIYIGYRQISKAPELLVSKLQEGAQMSLGKIRQTSIRDGKKEWSLEADSARYLNSENKVILTGIAVTFYLENNQEAYLTAKQGVLKTDSNDIEVAGDVVIKNEDYRLETEKLTYTNDDRIIVSKTPVVITAKSGDLAADSMAVDLNTNTVQLEGNIEGTIVEGISL